MGTPYQGSHLSPSSHPSSLAVPGRRHFACHIVRRHMTSTDPVKSCGPTRSSERSSWASHVINYVTAHTSSAPCAGALRAGRGVHLSWRVSFRPLSLPCFLFLAYTWVWSVVKYWWRTRDPGRVRVLDGGSLMFHVYFKKWQYPLSPSS